MVLIIILTIKGDKNLARIVGTYKILPEDPEIKPAVIKERIIKALPEDMKITASGERPIAFGLVALVVDINFLEQDGLQDQLEEILEKIEGVSEIEALQLFRL
ncbi:MAG: elongation factor 1-beta [Asgard group archaeon]|nr:elongation factor 1-beta [Asgard group archaeon]